MYNWGGSRPGYDGDSESVCRYNYVGNYGKPGPDSDRTGYAYAVGSPYFRAYYSGNHFFGKIPTKQWSLVNFEGFSSSEIAAYKRPIPYSTGPVETLTAKEAYSAVMAHVGASFRRDSVDIRVINDVQNGTGAIIDSPSDVGGWPLLNTLPAPLDTDQDGMPDQWEDENGLDLNDPTDRNGDIRGMGYTNLEEYLNELVQAIPIWYSLQVNSGSGSGAYPEGTEIQITAKNPYPGYEFDRWTGDTFYLADPDSINTVVTIPAAGVYLTATYRNVVSVRSDEQERPIRCYPNPTKGDFNIEFSSVGSFSLEVVNTLGQSVYHIYTTEPILRVTDPGFRSGLYYIHVTDDGKNRYSQKLMVE